MKFNPDIKYNQLSESYRSGLDFIDVARIKQGMWIFIILLYDLHLIMNMSFIEKIEFVWIIVPMAIVVHLWEIRHTFKNVYSTQVESILFMAVYSCIATITFLIVIIGLSIHALSMTSIYYYIILSLVIILSSYPIIKSQVDKLSSEPFKKREEKEFGSETLMYGAPGLGVFLTGATKNNIVLGNLYTTVLML